jgi:hypothetical protein
MSLKNYLIEDWRKTEQAYRQRYNKPSGDGPDDGELGVELAKWLLESVSISINIDFDNPLVDTAFEFGCDIAGVTRGGPGRLPQTTEHEAVCFLAFADDAGFWMLQFERDSAGWFPVYVISFQLGVDEVVVVRDFYSTRDAYGDDRYFDASMHSFRFLITSVGLLNMKHTLKTVNEPSPRIQAKRAARGQEPLETTVHVSLSPQVRDAYKGGTHASPKPHWRRGHMRLVHTREGPKYTAIQPTMVMGEAPLPKQLIVRG